MLAACSQPASTNAESPAGIVGTSSGLSIERYFPLVHDHLWNYDTVNDDGKRGRLLVRARRASATEGELRAPGGVRRFVYTTDGVTLLERGVYVLRTPLAVGTQWRGEHGGPTRIEAVNVSAIVPAGRFEGCIVTVEERGGDVRATYTTTFCPHVGIVSLDVDAGMQHERAELRSYGPPVNLGPPGTTMIGP